MRKGETKNCEDYHKGEYEIGSFIEEDEGEPSHPDYEKVEIFSPASMKPFIHYEYPKESTDADT